MTEQTSFLDAIQKIPGDTPGKKYQNIAQLVSTAVKNDQSISTLIENNQLPSLLGPYCNVEAAKIVKNHQMVAEALKSEDILVIEKALSIKSFFDGSDSDVTNPDYFRKYLIPHVSLNTRLKIIKNLSSQLREPHLAEQFFTVFNSLYGIEQAMPLLVACRPQYTHKILIEKNILPTRRIMKKLYKKDPSIVIRYIKDVRKNELLNTRTILRTNFTDYNDIIVKFIKVDIESFIEIVESYEWNKLELKFSKNLGRLFMRTGMKYLLDNPKLYTEMLPLEVIGVNTMRIIFPTLLPDKCELFNANTLLRFLKFFPKNERFVILEKSYASRYNKRILDDANIITPELMLLLPDKERVEQAKIMMVKNSEDKSTYYPLCWRCYSNPYEVIPLIKNDIAKASQIEDRVELIGQLIYCCKVNNDNNMFLEVLKYFIERHKNETAEMFFSLLNMLNEIYGEDLHSLRSEHWDVINGIIRRMHVKGYISNNVFVTNLEYLFKVLEASTHHKLLHDSPIEENIELLAHCNLKRYHQCWNILVNNSVFEEKCLSYFVDYVLQKIEDKSPSNKYWHEKEKNIVFGVTNAIYDYNERHMKSKRRLATKTLSVSDYPRLMKIVIELLNNKDCGKMSATREMRNLLRRQDKEFFEANVKNNIADVKSGEAFSLLKREPSSIFKHWKDYLSMCKCWSGSKNVIRFIKTVRWHNGIPMRWREECEKRFTDDPSYLGILGILVDGPYFEQLVSPFMPKQTTLQTDGPNARNDYLITSTIPSVYNLVNPPASLSIISDFFEGDYLSDGLRTSSNLCRRTAVSKVMAFLESSINQRVSVKKHVIRLICMVATIDDSCKLLSSQWQTEKHHSIRGVLFHKIHGLFLKQPTTETFSLLVKSIKSFTLDDSFLLILIASFVSVPNEYLAEYLSNTFAVFEKMKEDKLTVNYLPSMLNSIDSYVCDILDEDYCMRIIRKYLFNENRSISQSALRLAIDSFILSCEEYSERRLSSFVEMISGEIGLHWDQPHPRSQRLHYYGVNKVFYKFIEQFCNSYTSGKLNLKLVELLLGIFNNKLEPKMDLPSYLHLIYTKEQLLSISAKDFGLRIGSVINRLTREFSQMIIHLMSETMEKFLSPITSIDLRNSLMEGLLEENNINNYYMAAHLLQHSNCKDQKYQDTARVLLNCEYPIITSIARQKMNSVSEKCKCRLEN